MDPPRSNQLNHNDPQSHLGVSKQSRQIRKSPPPPSFRPSGSRPTAAQPQVYNISKNDFRDIVQKLTGTPTRDPIPSNSQPQVRSPPQQARPQSQPSQRLQRIRPPPLTPMARPMQPSPYQNPNPNPNQNQALMPSPVTAYMRYLENSLLDTSRMLPSQQPGLLPSPVDSQVQPQQPGPPPPPGLPLFPSPRVPFSPYLLQSPSAFLNLLSPKSPYPLLSPPGSQYPPQFPLSPGILGPVPGAGPPPPPGPPLSPGFFFPNSPSGLLSPSNFFPNYSPGWRNG